MPEPIAVPRTEPPRYDRVAALLDTLELMSLRALAWCAEPRWRASAILALLCLALYLPGVFTRPPVDRTEVLYAQAARQMLERGDALVPRTQSTVNTGRPVGFLWLQAASARLLGPASLDAIWAYRLPAVLGATLSVLFLYLGLNTILGARAAFCAATVLAGSLLLAIQARLALPQTTALAAAVVAQTSLSRLYLGAGDTTARRRRRDGLLFWAALGVGVLINSLIVPILAALTVIGLWAQDRHVRWLGRLGHLPGVLLALALAAPWGASLWAAAGADPGPSLSALQWLALVVDHQAMKWRAFPGSYLLTLGLGLLPFVLLLPAACLTLWRHRHLQPVRFLLAWLVPYLIVFEIVSHKPPLYMVPYVAIVLAVAVALRLIDNPVTGAPRPLALNLPLTVVGVGLALMLAITPLVLHGLLEPLTPAAIAAAGVAAGALALGTLAVRRNRPLAAVSSSLCGGAALYALVFALMLPTTRAPWPSTGIAEIRDALARCYPEPAVVAGYTEPSAAFLLGTATLLAGAPAAIAHLERHPRALAFVERSELEAFSVRGLAATTGPLVRLACSAGHSPFTGRKASFSVFARALPPADARCEPALAYRCP